MVMTSVIYDDMLITGRSLDGKMSFKFTAKNGNNTEISEKRPDNIMAFVKRSIFDVMDTALQDLTNDEEIWFDISETIMIANNELADASNQSELEINAKNMTVATKVLYEKITSDFLHQKFSSSYEEFNIPYGEYEYDVKVHYHFSPSGQVDDKISYQLELTSDGKTTFWK